MATINVCEKCGEPVYEILHLDWNPIDCIEVTEYHCSDEIDYTSNHEYHCGHVSYTCNQKKIPNTKD